MIPLDLSQQQSNLNNNKVSNEVSDTIIINLRKNILNLKIVGFIEKNSLQFICVKRIEKYLLYKIKINKLKDLSSINLTYSDLYNILNIMAKEYKLDKSVLTDDEKHDKNVIINFCNYLQQQSSYNDIVRDIKCHI